MTQEEKDLLLKVLCAMLPYGVKCINVNWPKDGYVRVYNIRVKEQKIQIFEDWADIEYCKPYLRPMSSMTEEEIKELNKIDLNRVIFSSRHLTYHLDGAIIDYLNSHHFDYLGLIEKGLALEAPEGIYN